MKNIFLIGLLVVFLFSGCENLFNNEYNPRNVSVAEAKNLRDGTYVKISGAIETTILKDLYILSDRTGTIIIEIEAEVWARAGIVNPSVMLPGSFEIVGEIEKEPFHEAIIELSRLKHIQN